MSKHTIGPPPPTGLPKAPPPPPTGLPGPRGPAAPAPAPSSLAQRSLSKCGGANPPQPPDGLPGTNGYPSSSPGAAPPPPVGVPGAPRPSVRPATGGTCGPPPPAGLPAPSVARTGPSETGFTTPQPPVGLPGVLGRKSPSQTGGNPACKAGPPPPPSKASLPGASRCSTGNTRQLAAESSTAAPEEDVEAEASKADGWRQYLESEDTDESEDASDDDSASGEDSDEEGAADCAARSMNDMAALMRQHSLVGYGGRSSTSVPTSMGVAEEAKDVSAEIPEGLEHDGKEDGGVTATKEKSLAAPKHATTVASPSPSKKQSRMFAFANQLFRSSGGTEDARPHGVEVRSVLDLDTSKYDDQWLSQWSARFGKDGLICTKVATNGKPYERRLCIDARNLELEIRGGRTGSTGVLLDDLIDIWYGLNSLDFTKFCQRFKKDLHIHEVSKRAIVLQTPARSFSFLLSGESQRDVVGAFIVYLLKSRKRGVLATESTTTGEKTEQSEESSASTPPKNGHGKVKYGNNSTYEGQFQNHMRHGFGTYTLSEGTQYASEWRHDERHGKGREAWADGTIFVGQYAKGMRSGNGVIKWPEGSKYSGHFERGRANGEGELVRTDGSVYRGFFAEDCMAGEGHMVWPDGVEYSGQFAGNRRDGAGKMIWKGGKWKSYDGEWKEGLQHGHGTLMDHDDQSFSGQFHGGNLEMWDDDARPDDVPQIEIS